MMIKQSGVIPYRIRDGKVEVLLITSSKGQRWGIPKGWIEPGMTAVDSAVKEAREEAGVIGVAMPSAIGTYQSRKLGLPCRVEVFLMRVDTVLDDWAEAKVRQRQWLSVPKAMKSVKNAELKAVLESLQELPSESLAL